MDLETCELIGPTLSYRNTQFHNYDDEYNNYQWPGNY